MEEKHDKGADVGALEEVASIDALAETLMGWGRMDALHAALDAHRRAPMLWLGLAVVQSIPFWLVAVLPVTDPTVVFVLGLLQFGALLLSTRACEAALRGLRGDVEIELGGLPRRMLSCVAGLAYLLVASYMLLFLAFLGPVLIEVARHAWEVVPGSAVLAFLGFAVLGSLGLAMILGALHLLVTVILGVPAISLTGRLSTYFRNHEFTGRPDAQRYGFVLASVSMLALWSLVCSWLPVPGLGVGLFFLGLNLTTATWTYRYLQEVSRWLGSGDRSATLEDRRLFGRVFAGDLD